VKRFVGSIPVLFAVAMIGNGIYDLVLPDVGRAAFDTLSLPYYLLTLIAAAKIAGGLTLLAGGHSLLAEWAYAGFFIWASGGLASHILAGDRFANMLPLMGLTVFLIASFVVYRRA